MNKVKFIFILLSLIFCLISLPYVKASDNSALEKAIENEIISKYSITDNDRIEKYNEDLDNDGQKEVLAVLVKEDKNDTYDNINSYSSFFIFKPDGPIYKLVFFKNLPKGYIEYRLRGDNTLPPVVKIVKISGKVFFAFDIMTRPGANGYNWMFLVYTYDGKGQKYKQVYASKEEHIPGYTRPFELFIKDGNVWISLLYMSGGTSVKPEFSKVYFYWDELSFLFRKNNNYYSGKSR